MSTPRLTSAVRRGLLAVLGLVQADLDADQSEDQPRYTGSKLNEIERAIEWITHKAFKEAA